MPKKLVVGSPTFKGSYTGLFKHFIDVLDPSALKAKPVIVVATRGGKRQSLIVEHQLRPLFGFRARGQQAAAEACRALGEPASVSLAA